MLYARVSSDAQQKEGTIESQVAELKRQIAAAGHELVKEYIDDGIIRQFCATAKARLQACTESDTNRQFLLDYVERVVFDHYKVTVVGTVPLQTTSEISKLAFRIEGKIDIVAIRSAASRRAALEAMRTLQADTSTAIQSDRTAPPPCRESLAAKIVGQSAKGGRNLVCR